MIHDVYTTSTLFLTQAVITNIKCVDVQQRLALSDFARSSIVDLTARSHLYLSHFVVTRKTLNLSVSQNLNLQQETQPRVYNVSAENWLVLAQLATYEDKWPLVEQRLNLTQVASVEKALGTHSTLVLTHLATVNITKNLVAESTLTLISNATAYKPDKYWTSYDVVVIVP